MEYSLESETFETRRVELFVKNIFESNIYSQVRHFYFVIFYSLYMLKLFTKFNRAYLIKKIETRDN